MEAKWSLRLIRIAAIFALTMGHPYGASGAIMVTRLFYEVQRRKGIQYVLASIGSAGGVGLAVLFEVIQ